MKVFLDTEKLYKLAQNMYELTKVSLSILGADGLVIIGYGQEPYCSYIYDCLGNDKCQECDKRATEMVKKTKTTFSYTCHALLSETISPVFVSNEIVAYVCFGEYITQENTYTDEEIINFANEKNIDSSKLLGYYKKLPILTKKQVESISEITGSCIQLMVLEQHIKLYADSTIEKFVEYIENNITTDLSISKLCKTFFISKNKLYELFKESYGLTIQKYITKLRLEKAKELLLTTNLSVSSISEKVGFTCYNNFIKLFKSEYKETPLQFRKTLSPIKED